MKFDQDLCATCDMNSTLGSVVPLAMFSINMVQGFLCPSTVSRNNPLIKSNPFDGKLFKFKHFIERKNPENYDGDKL